MNSNPATPDAQYSLAKILGLWVAVSALMGILAWIIFPALKDRVSLPPNLFPWVGAWYLLVNGRSSLWATTC